MPTMWIWGTLIQVSRLGSKCRNISLDFLSQQGTGSGPPRRAAPPPHPDLSLQAGKPILHSVQQITPSPHPHLPPPSQYLQLPQCLAGWQSLPACIAHVVGPVWQISWAPQPHGAGAAAPTEGPRGGRIDAHSNAQVF